MTLDDKTNGAPTEPASGKLRPYWWKDRDFDEGTTQRWRDQCAAERSQRTARQRPWDRLQQSRWRREAARVFQLHHDAGAVGVGAVERFWPGWAAVMH